MYSLCGNIKSDYYLKVRDSQVRLYHASPIPTETRQKNSFGWAATGLLMSSPVHFHCAMLVCTEYLFFCFKFDTFTHFTHVCTNQSYFWFVAEGKRFKSDIRVMHVRDLNFVLRLEIFVHTDEQLRASHLILGCNPMYISWQPFSQALLVDSPPPFIYWRSTHQLPPTLIKSRWSSRPGPQIHYCWGSYIHEGWLSWTCVPKP